MSPLEQKVEKLSNSVEHIQEDLTDLKEKTADMNEALGGAIRSIDKLTQVIVGDDFNANAGMALRQKDHEKRILDIEKLLIQHSPKEMSEKVQAMERIKWQGKGAWFVVGIVAAFAMQFFFWYISRK